MALHAHFVERCKHGTVVMQCRCPSQDKLVTIVACPETCNGGREEQVGEVREMISVERTHVSEFRDEAANLMLEHHREVVLRPEIQKLKPNWRKYYELELRGELAVLAGWSGAKMIGYSMNFWSDHLHDEDLRVFHNDAIFVTEAHRGSGLGKKLLVATEVAARQAECQIMHTHAKPGSTLARMLGGRGFRGNPEHAVIPDWFVQDIVFSKVLVA